MHILLTLACTMSLATVAMAAPWPGGSEDSISISNASSDLSGATWNPGNQSLWVIRQNRHTWEFTHNPLSGNFELVQTLVLPSGIGTDIEACALVDHDATDELYTLDEDNGRIARVIDINSTPTVQHTWDLETLNNGNAMPPETKGLGAEGLEFAPDANLLASGFRYPDGSAFTGSTRGMGGLIIVGHQIDGRLHVFDINPDASDDFINHGSFLTAVNEIAGLHFDRDSGLMHVWHNPKNVNSLEVSTLSSDDLTGTIDIYEHYDSDMPDGNIEGIALVDRDSCGQFSSDEDERVIFFTRDGESPYLSYADAFPCTCPGACCVSSGCDLVTMDSCDNFGGNWLGDGVPCADCPTTCIGDVNSDGAVDMTDLLKIIEHWGVCP
ncbi:MAG: hypothetical protein P8L37_05255 [Phycisphaerales bacterium]|nr:hypothetical protein [Phycisphaerales bacterium]